MGDSSLWGSITDATNAGVPGVTVLIRNLETGTERSLLTDESGRFNAAALPVGRYDITASKADFQTAYRGSVSLAVGQRAEVDFQLRVGEVRQTVEVPVVSTALEITTEDILAWSENAR